MDHFAQRWDNLVTLARKVPADERDAPPFGFADRVVSLARTHLNPSPVNVLEPLALKGLVIAIAVAAIVVGYSTIAASGADGPAYDDVFLDGLSGEVLPWPDKLTQVAQAASLKFAAVHEYHAHLSLSRPALSSVNGSLAPAGSEGERLRAAIFILVKISTAVLHTDFEPLFDRHILRRAVQRAPCVQRLGVLHVNSGLCAPASLGCRGKTRLKICECLALLIRFHFSDRGHPAETKMPDRALCGQFSNKELNFRRKAEQFEMQTHQGRRNPLHRCN
jgi:hypothetical protein